MAYGAMTFSDGFAERMTSRDMACVYSALPWEVHDLAEQMLDPDTGDTIPVYTDLIDTPALAVRALQVNIGRTLPTYDYTSLGYVAAQSGETRQIGAEDRFAITEGPRAISPRPPHRFLTVLERAVRPAEAIPPLPRDRLSTLL